MTSSSSSSSYQTICDAFSIVGAVSTQIMKLAPIPVMIQIAKNKSVFQYPSNPYIIGAIYGVVNGIYAGYTSQTVALISSITSVAFYLVYDFIYIYYSKDKKATTTAAINTKAKTSLSERAVAICNKLLPTRNPNREITKLLLPMAISIVLSLLLPYMIVLATGSSGDDKFKFLSNWFGSCASIAVTFLFASQLTSTAWVFRHKNSSPISIWLTIGSLICSICWNVYSIMAVDWYYIASNTIGILAGVFQLVLTFVYPPIRTKDNNSNEGEDADKTGKKNSNKDNTCNKSSNCSLIPTTTNTITSSAETIA